MSKFPKGWRKDPPHLTDHHPGDELVWAVRGHPFNRPVIAQTNVGVRKTDDGYERFVVTRFLSDGFCGVNLYPENPILHGLEWRGPIVIPKGLQ